MAIKCTVCGHVISNTQAAVQIGTKAARDLFGLNGGGSGASKGIISDALAGLAVENNIRCPKCGIRGCFCPA